MAKKTVVYDGCEIHPSQFLSWWERLASWLFGLKLERRLVVHKLVYETFETADGGSLQIQTHHVRVEVRLTNGCMVGTSRIVGFFSGADFSLRDIGVTDQNFALAKKLAASDELTADEENRLRAMFA